jgi:conjugative transfer relaxase protein TraI
MLSIQPLESAEGASNYYLDVANYYAQDSNSIRWLGLGAKELGLQGQNVQKEQMIALLNGRLPDGIQLGRIDKEGIHHRPGFDMTLSAPKSFSILLETGADPRLVKILDDTVEWFVGEMEKECEQTRQFIDGKIEYVDTGNFVISAFRQPNSRANDPQSHVHLVVHNMTHCHDGKWRSLASDMNGRKGVVEQIMKHHIYGGLKFRNKLANATKALGYELTSDGEGLWEIQGVPDSLLTHFSKRRQAIEALLEEKGWQGAKASSLAAQKTKLDKEDIDLSQWRDSVLQQCQELEFDPQHFVTSIKPQKSFLQTLVQKITDRFQNKDEQHMEHAREAMNVASESVSQQHAVFDRRSLKREALKYSIASHHMIDERLIDKALDEHVNEQHLYEAQHPYTKEPLYTTPWQLTLESETIARIEEGKNAINPITSKSKVAEFIKFKESELSFSLSASQEKAMIGFLTTTDRYIAIQGYAGTGKTTMLRLTQELASSYGYNIRGITAGSSAANELAVKGGIDATTFARELGQLQKEKKDLSKTIFVVDEASMLSNPQGHKIIKLVEQFNSQLKIIGDRAQLPSPSSGCLFSIMQDYGIDTVAMTDNLRQKDAKLKESASHAGKGEIYDAIEKLTNVHIEETYLERVSLMAKTWLSLSLAERENTLCFAPTHQNRHDITGLIRKSLQEEGVLKGTEHRHAVLKEKPFTSIKLRQSMYYSPQNVIRFNTKIARFEIKAGDYWVVGKVTKEHKKNNTLLLSNSEGRELTFPLRALPKFKTQNKDLERPLEVYTQSNLALMTGDKIQWKRNSQKYGIRNSELGTVKSINEHHIEIASEDKSILLKANAPELKHLDHGYVLTTYAAQGKDKKRGIGLIESCNRFAATIQNFYVEVTRAIDSMTVITDNKNNLVKAISLNDSEKYSALEMVSSATLEQHKERFKNASNQLKLEPVIEKKRAREQDWTKLEQHIEDYAHNKRINNKCVAAKLAHSIVKTPDLYRLAKERLSFKETTYRRDALRYETAKLFHSLSPEDKKHFSLVREYIKLNELIAKRHQHSKQNQSIKSPKGSNKQELNKLTIIRNHAAARINGNKELYKPYLNHYSIGELNRIGLSQHEYRDGEVKAQKRLGEIAKYALLDEVMTNNSFKQAMPLNHSKAQKLKQQFIFSKRPERNLLKTLGEVAIEINQNSASKLVSDYLKNNKTINISNTRSAIFKTKTPSFDRDL